MKSENRNLLSEILINIFLPTVILEKGAKYFPENGATWALVIGLSLPLIYGVYDYIKNKRTNFVAILGFISLLATGGLGLFKFEGIWFAVKEAAFPCLIGIVVLISAFTKKPLISLLINNESLVQKDKLKSALVKNNTETQFQEHLKKSTIFFSFSFFFSALLNYLLAIRIFKEIPKTLSEDQRANILNSQIAEMTWQGYVVILIPSLIIMAFILWHLFRGIKEYTGYKIEDIINDPKKKKEA